MLKIQFYIMKWIKDINDKQDIIKLLIHKYCSYLRNEVIGLTINSLFMNIDIELTDDEKKIFIANDITLQVREANSNFHNLFFDKSFDS